MDNGMLNTRIVLRNDSSANWLINEAQVLLKGEVGIEFTDNGKAKVKIGDGSKSWKELEYFGNTEFNNVNDLIAELKIADANLSEQVTTLEQKLYGAGEDSIDAKVKKAIDEFASIITDNGSIETFKEIVEYISQHGSEFGDLLTEVSSLKTAIGTKPVAEQLEAQMVESKAVFQNKKYDITNVPEGTQIAYFDHEIRVMCPESTVWQQQNVGETGNANMYYMAFKAYAPEGAVGFKEGDRGVIVNEYHTFDESFSGTDIYGRNYSICWLALASYDSAKDAWNYFGKTSNENKYIGWDYIVEWYDANGKVITTDTVRINLSNENCHNINRAYNIVSGVKLGDTLLTKVNGIITLPANLGLKASDEIKIAEDGTLSIGTIDAKKINQATGEFIILNGGMANGKFE